MCNLYVYSYKWFYIIIPYDKNYLKEFSSFNTSGMLRNYYNIITIIYFFYYKSISFIIIYTHKVSLKKNVKG